MEYAPQFLRHLSLRRHLHPTQQRLQRVHRRNHHFVARLRRRIQLALRLLGLGPAQRFALLMALSRLSFNKAATCACMSRTAPLSGGSASAKRFSGSNW